ncbi:MAG: biopolymer transporter ExbD [Alphaproteobacteria bacterium]|nr:biopolymer transporter ExbD [Alphaproteobacteria bacterium]
MRFTRRGRRPEASVDLTPMLDVTFNLVLFFAVTTNFVQTEQAPGIEVDLPRASSETVLSDDGDMDVWVAADGAVYLDDQPVTLAQLDEAFRARAAAKPSTLVVIKADEGVAHGRVVAVMDYARNRGLSRLAIATRVGDDGG